jgi:hypothetical protein
MAQRNLSGIFWLLFAILVVALPLACGGDDSGGGSSGTSGVAPADAMTAG